MAKVFHISRHYIGDLKCFTPKNPVSQNKSELDLSPRICASAKLEGCWEAIKCCNDLLLEMESQNINGYYFFIYSFDAGNFYESPVFDAKKTGEVISHKYNCKGTFESAFYVKTKNLKKDFNIAKEDSSNDEAINAYEEYQKEVITYCEDIINEMAW